MMDLIDRNELEPDTEWSDYYDGFTSYSQSQINGAVEVQAIIILEGASNGDMIKALFPNLEIVDNGFHNITVIFGDYRNQMYRNHYDEEWWNAPFIQPSTPNHNEPEEHSCFKCRYLGWENVGDGMNPICEQEPYIEDTSDKDSSLHKSKPTVSGKNDCYWFDEKEK